MTTQKKTILKVAPAVSAKMQKLFLQNQDQNFHHLQTVLLGKKSAKCSNKFVKVERSAMCIHSHFPTTERNLKEPAYV